MTLQNDLHPFSLQVAIRASTAHVYTCVVYVCVYYDS